MIKQKKLAILREDDIWCVMLCPYKKDFLESFKANIEPKLREPVFNEQGKFVHWRIHKGVVSDVVKLMSDFWPEAEIESDLVEEGSDWISQVFDVVPERHWNRIFKALSFGLHPDQNPGIDKELIKRLNAEYQRRKSEQGD